MAKVALGFRAHTGWAAAVALAGAAACPEVIERRRVELTDGSFPAEVYHAAWRGGGEEAEELIREATQAAETAAEGAVRTLIDELVAKRHRLVGCGVVLGSGFAASTLAGALSSHAGRHAAEGELYRQALIRAVRVRDLPVTGAAERLLYGRISAALTIPVDELRERVTELGRGLGPPWGQDQKSAALVAWLALADG